MGSDAHSAGSVGLQEPYTQIHQLLSLLLPTLQLKPSGSHR